MLKFEKLKFLIIIFIYIILIITGTSSLAQSKISGITATGFKVYIDIPEFKHRDVRKGNYIERDYYEFTDESSPGELKLPHQSVVLALPQDSKPVFNITDKISHIEKFILPTLNPQVLLDDKGQLTYNELELDKIISSGSNSIINIKGYFYLRGIYCVALDINPCIYDDKTNSLEVIEQLQVDINYGNYNSVKNQSTQDNNSAFDENLDEIILNSTMIPEFKSVRSSISDTLYDWIDFNSTYLKMGVADDGIYRVFKQDLEDFGINTSAITPNTFKIFLKGKQIPIFVYGEEDNIFNDTDYIEFYGSKNYADGNYRVVNEHSKPYSEYIDRYSDTTIYWLTWDGDQGQRVDTVSYNLPGIQDTVTYYSNIEHYEQNNYLDYNTRSQVTWENPEWIYNESWIWGTQGVGTASRPFFVSELVDDQPAKAFWRVQSRANFLPRQENVYDLGLSINNFTTVYDSGFMDNYEQKILIAEFSSNLLQSGQNNLMTHSFLVENAIYNEIYIDWYEVEYPRYLVLINDSLKFKFNQALSPSLKVLKLSNAISSNYILYKISSNRRLTNFSRNGITLFFNDTLKTGDEFFIAEENKFHSPKFYYKKQFENLVDPNNQADYVLVSNPAIFSSVTSYLEFIQENYPVNVKYINVIDIYDQFNYGFFSPEPIKEFLKQANQYWMDPKPSYLFLVGEANYDYHNYSQLNPYVNNIVPSFGHPVSDTWFAIWDSVSFIPQMFVGRLPAKNDAEVTHYLNKHTKYFNDPYNVWNKSYFLLSGGNTESERIICKNVNDNLRTNYIQNYPTGGYVGQLYATDNPRTNFGPFPQEYIDSVFNNGGVIVSYVGHSGTKVWDNGIESVDDLKNNFNKYPLINDFGCSTGKFAEFDITSFSEAFVNGLDGDAISYNGNSSLGFTSTSYTFPQLYFQKLLKERIINTGATHLTAKVKLLEDYGYNETTKLFVLCNTLIGDPLIKIKIPEKPNLIIEPADIKIPPYLDDNLDSISVVLHYRNIGSVDSSQFNIRIEDRWNNQLIFETILRHNLPLNDKTFNLNLPIKSKKGEHNLRIVLDDQNEIDELYEDDNSVTVQFLVLTTSVRAIVADSLKILNDEYLTFLNSVKKPATDSILIRISSNPDFIGESAYKIKFDSVITPFSFTNLVNGKRYWFRTSFTSSPETIFERNSFIYSDSVKYNFAFIDSNSVSGFQFQSMKYENGVIRLKDRYIPLIISSAGFESGGLAKISLDGIDYTENSRGCGHHIVVIDEATFQFEEYRWFNWWYDPVNHYQPYIDYLTSIPEGKLVAISIGGECGGANIDSSLKAILHQFGSVYIDSVVWGSSWILLGKKNAPQGSVPEAFSTTGPVEFDTTFFSKTLAGWFETNRINNSGKWRTMSLEVDSIDNNNSIRIKPIIHKPQADTLNEFSWYNNLVDISSLNNQNIDELSFNFNVDANEDGSTPQIKSAKIDYDLVPELATNYQVTGISKDSVLIGEDIELHFYVYNVGESKSDSFTVKVEVINDDNSRQTIFDQRIDSLNINERKYFNIDYNTSAGSGSKSFLISIDPDDEIRELFEDNNFFSIPFYVQPDTSVSEITLTFDGYDIVDGEFISAEPSILVELNDESFLPITDPSSVMVYLNDDLISPDSSIITYTFSQENPKVKVDFKPTLSDGEYTLKVLWRNAEGNIVDSSGVVKYFQVSSEAQLLYVYNYPNPTSGETYFTFKLTQIPDNIQIKIYTIAGRLIKEFDLNSSQLKFDFNKIYWDGRDEDGDPIGNGVYLYKVIMQAGETSQDVTQKLAIVK